MEQDLKIEVFFKYTTCLFPAFGYQIDCLITNNSDEKVLKFILIAESFGFS